jgi:hypothetical protein
MKNSLFILIFCVASGLSLGLFRASAELEVSARVSIQASTDFYEPLAPSGAWVDVGSYGHCWHPTDVEAGWRPYCNGYWEWTDAGWYWISDERWAWACYHYGTWVDDPGFGWCWVPGIEWAPAWVYWRTGGDHIGWAPCGPAGFIVQPSFFVFVESRHFHDRIRPDNVIENNTTIINNTTEIKNIRRESRQFDGKSQTVIINEGPRVDDVEKATGQKFATVSVREADRKTFISIPEKLKNRSAEPAPNEKSRNVQEQSNPAPGKNPEMPNNMPSKKEMPVEKVIPTERTIPQAPSKRIIPPANKELPVGKEQHPKEIVHPPEPPPHPATPVMPPGNPGANEKDQDKDKDHGNSP